MIDLKLLFTDYLFIIHQLQHNIAKVFLKGFKGNVLDVGCGRRPYKKYLGADVEYVGVDINTRLKPDIVVSALNMPFKKDSFDGVIASEVIEHLKEPKIFLKYINAILKAGGALYITAPMNWNLHYEPDDYFRFTNHGLIYLLEENGFKIKEVKRIGGFFSLISVKLIDVFVVSILFRIAGLLKIERGKYRISAILMSPLNFCLYILSMLIDLIDSRDAIGWVILAEKI